MRRNPKHLFHAFLRQNHIPYSNHKDCTVICNTHIDYDYQAECLIYRHPLMSELSMTTPFKSTAGMFNDFIRFSKLVLKMSSSYSQVSTSFAKINSAYKAHKISFVKPSKYENVYTAEAAA